MAGSVDESPAGGHTAQEAARNHDDGHTSAAAGPPASEDQQSTASTVAAAVETLGELATLPPPLLDYGSEGSDYELDDFGQLEVGELLLLQANLQHLKQKMRGEVSRSTLRCLRFPGTHHVFMSGSWRR
jgi:hypothetical protein